MHLLFDDLMPDTIVFMRTTINLPPKLLEAAKRQAKLNDLTLSSYVEEVIRTALEHVDSTPHQSTAVTLPVFDCGPMLVDIDDKDALWEVLDDRP